MAGRCASIEQLAPPLHELPHACRASCNAPFSTLWARLAISHAAPPFFLCQFVKSLKDLMADLKQSNALFVRCIKPNPEKQPNRIHGKSVIDQLRQSGTLDAVRLIQGGYPARIPYDAIHSRYAKLLTGIPGVDIESLSPSEFCEAIAEACGVAKSECAASVTSPSSSSSSPPSHFLLTSFSPPPPSHQVRPRHHAHVLPHGRLCLSRGGDCQNRSAHSAQTRTHRLKRLPGTPRCLCP